MSLLMDALKRAEQAKRQQASDSAANPSSASGALQLAPVEPDHSDARVSPLPDLNSHLDSVEADLKATAAEHPTRRAGTAQKADNAMDRAIAQNVLAAGAASVGATRKDNGAASGSKPRLIAIISVGGLAAAGIGGYFYWQLQGISQGGSLVARPGLAMAPARPPPITSPAVPAAAPTGQDAPTAAPVAAPATTASASTQAAHVPASSTTGQTKASGKGAVVFGHAATRGASPAASRPPVAKLVTNPAASPQASDSPAPLRVTSQSQDSPVMRGYEALQAGRFAEAKSAYTQALRTDPRDTDALLGLAALAQREGQSGSAGEYYERVLQNDPRNAAAYAGLSALQGGADPGQAESRLKSLLNLQNSDPNATSPLNFALGNLYAGQRRWSEAQQAYFRAHTADAGNPDTLYNLAISLEHMNQPALARQFYEQALQAIRQRAASFDRAQAEKRLAALAR